jgi:hypothetical protein
VRLTFPVTVALFAVDVNMLGRCSFQLPELPGGMRPLRETDADQG